MPEEKAKRPANCRDLLKTAVFADPVMDFPVRLHTRNQNGFPSGLWSPSSKPFPLLILPSLLVPSTLNHALELHPHLNSGCDHLTLPDMLNVPPEVCWHETKIKESDPSQTIKLWSPSSREKHHRQIKLGIYDCIIPGLTRYIDRMIDKTAQIDF